MLGLFELSSRDFKVRGAGADKWLRGLVTGALPRGGRVGLVYFSDDKGRIVTEMSVTREAEDNFVLVTAATAVLAEAACLIMAGKPLRPSLIDGSALLTGWLLALTLLLMNNRQRWVGRPFRNGAVPNMVLAATLLFFACVAARKFFGL